MSDDPKDDLGATERPNLSTEHQKQGDGKEPSDLLDKGRESTETIPRKSSLL